MNLTDMCEIGAVRNDVIWRDKDIASISPDDLDAATRSSISELKPDPLQAVLQLRAMLPTRPDVGQ